MKRRVIRLGGSTLVVSLPSKWVRKHNLAAGSELEISEEADALRIGAAEPPRPERTVVLAFADTDWNGTRPEKYVQRLLATAYKQGADTIVVRSRSKQVLDYVERRVEGFIGIEIIDQRPDAVIIKSLVRGLEMEFESVLQRAVLLTAHIAHEAVGAIRSGDAAAIENLLRLERTHNKITDFAKRLLALKSPVAPEDKYVYAFVTEDERLVDEYKNLLEETLSAFGAKRRYQVASSTIELLEQTNAYLDMLLALVQHPTRELVRSMATEYPALLAKTTGGSQKSDAKLRLFLHAIVVRIYELGETVLLWKS